MTKRKKGFTAEEEKSIHIDAGKEKKGKKTVFRSDRYVTKSKDRAITNRVFA